MRADEWLEELVQLYEYRVEDLTFGRSPRGDRHSFQALRETLLFSDALDGAARKRLMQTERQFRDLQRQGRVHFAVASQLRAAPTMDPASDLQGTLQALSDRLWEADAQRWVFARLWATRCEPRLMALRILASASENLRRSQHGQAPAPLMTLEGALGTGLTRPTQIAALADALLSVLSTAAGRQRLNRAIEDLAQSQGGHAYQLPLGQHTAPTQWGESDARDKPAAAFYDPAENAGSAELLLTDQTPVWAAEQQLLGQTVSAIQGLLGQWPTRNPVRGSAELLTPDLHETGASALAVNLAELEERPRPLLWRGLKLNLRRSGTDTELRLAAPDEKERTLSLRSDLPAELRLWNFDLGGQLIQAALEDDLLLLRSERAAPRALQVIANRARLCTYLAQPHQAYASMRLARAAALLLRGRTLEGNDFSAASAARYAPATPAQMGQLAARALEALLALSSPLPEWQRTQKFQEAAQALSLSPAEGLLMSELLGTAHLPDMIFDSRTLDSGGFPDHRTFALLEWPATRTTLLITVEV
ncbi:hypothetical protein [Deinococcus piscis]|nr:hypothetical protein [Deinococcus piscis]